MAKKKRYNYIKKKLARGSYPAVAAVLLSLLLLVLCVGVSVWYQGEAPMFVGALGLSAMVAALWGLYYTLQAFRDEDKNFIVAKAAGGGAAFLLLLWLIIILVGFGG